MLLLGLAGSFFINHSFYHNYSATESIWDWGKSWGPGNLYFLSALRDERDYLIGRKSFYHEGFLRQSFNFLGDTGAVSLSASRKKQGGAGYTATEASGGIALFLAASPREGLRITSLSQMESRGYSSHGNYQDNSGIREDLGIELSYPLLQGDLGLVGEARPLNGERSLSARPRILIGPGSVSADISAGESYYLTVSGEESKSFYDVSLSGAFPEVGFLSLLPRLYTSGGNYSLNRLNSSASLGGELGARLRTALGATRWEFGLTRGLGERDFYEYRGDEREVWARADFSVNREFSGGSRAYLRSWISRTGYDYPQRFLPNDRDDRTLSAITGVRATMRPGLTIELGFLARNQDLVFIRPERSHETRCQDRYALFGKCAWAGPISMEFICEISAVYNTYRFSPQDNLLIRFYENAMLLKAQAIQSTVRFRLQDHGGYAGGIYYPSSFSREFWFQPSLRVFSIGSTGVFLMGRSYLREERGRDGWATAIQEEGMGLGTRKGGVLEGRVLLMKRTGEDPFWDIGLYYNPAQ